MQVAPEFQQDPAALSMLYVQAPGGKLVPLSAVVPPARRWVRSRSTTSASCRRSRSRSTSRRASRSATRSRRVEQLARETLPGTVSGELPGHGAGLPGFDCRGLGWVLALAIFVIYVVLGILYESFIHPLTILSGLPSAGFGALLTLLLFKQDLEHLRLRRRHHAGRAGQEERHHDDRLRDRRAPRAEAELPPMRSTRPAWYASVRS